MTTATRHRHETIHHESNLRIGRCYDCPDLPYVVESRPSAQADWTAVKWTRDLAEARFVYQREQRRSKERAQTP